MYIAILGRQPTLGMAELERLYGAKNTSWFSEQSALITTDSFPLERVGGTLKAGRVTLKNASGDWPRVSTKIVQEYTKKWSAHEGKVTLGISAYGLDTSAREVQKTGIILKQALKKAGVSLRLIPNDTPQLNTATSHHNKLGLSSNKVELLVVRAPGGQIIVAESIGAQNITALARRDQGRPKRDAFVGMLPPKLAQIMLNLATEGRDSKEIGTILDPFCGTGVLVQESLLMGYDTIGSDIDQRMVDYTRDNIEWLKKHYPIWDASYGTQVGDAMTTRWEDSKFLHNVAGEIVDAVRVPLKIGAVVCETYLGQPFSAPPSPEKLDQVRKNCDHIITKFLQNIARQTKGGTPFCLAVPAWRDTAGNITHLPLIKKLEQLGFVQHKFKNVSTEGLLYYREEQVVARELLILTRLDRS